MSNALLSFLFDGVLAALLIATISYCSRLSRRIRQLQDGRGELAEMIARFDSATGRATASLAELQTVSKKITEALQLKIDKANFLADDLAFLIEKSSKLLTRIEEAGHKLKPQPSSVSRPERPVFFEAGNAARFVKPPQAPDTSKPAAGSLEAVLQRLSAGSQGAEPLSASMPRTSAERELLDALKSGR